MEPGCIRSFLRTVSLDATSQDFSFHQCVYWRSGCTSLTLANIKFRTVVFFFKQDKDDICRFEIHSWPGEIVQLFSFAWNDSKKFSRVYKYVLTCYLDQNNSGVRWSRHFFLNGLSCHVKYSHLTRCDAMDPPGAPSWGNGRTWVSISC